MTANRHALIIGALAAIAIAGIILLQALGRTLPDVLSTVALVAVSALAGLAIPGITAAAVTLTAPPTGDAPAPPATLAVVAQNAAQDAPSSPQNDETTAAGVTVPADHQMAAG